MLMAEFVTVGEAAGRLKVSTRTIYRWIWEGKISKSVLYLPSGRIRISWDDLLEELRSWGLLNSR